MGALDAINEACVEAGVCQPEPTDHELLLHFGQTELGSPGIVRDPARAKGSVCTCFKYKPKNSSYEKEICWTRGIIGTLTQEQQRTYCVDKNYVEHPKLVKRYTQFAEAAEAAHRKVESIPKGERLQPWLSAMSAELSKRGIEV